MLTTWHSFISNNNPYRNRLQLAAKLHANWFSQCKASPFKASSRIFQHLMLPEPAHSLKRSPMEKSSSFSVLPRLQGGGRLHLRWFVADCSRQNSSAYAIPYTNQLVLPHHLIGCSKAVFSLVVEVCVIICPFSIYIGIIPTSQTFFPDVISFHSLFFLTGNIFPMNIFSLYLISDQVMICLLCPCRTNKMYCT